MKLINAAHELIYNMRAFFQTNSKHNYLNEEPLRSELFSSDQMERFGKTLAKTHNLSIKPTRDILIKRLTNNEIILNEVRKLLTDSIKKKYQIPPAGEWLIDNFYLIEENIRNAKIHFPKGYSEDLPQLSNGESGGMTRIYDIILRIISHSDGRIDIESLSSFIKAYQSVTNLNLGELWAIPIMLRLGLIENLRRVSARVAIDRLDGNLADYWARQMIETAEKDPKNMILVISDMARSNPPMMSAFVSELTRQLRGKGPDLSLALNWIELQLSDSGLTSNELINAEIQKQAADQVSMSNSIGSLRLLGTMDWKDFIEAHSIVEKTLCEDNSGVYKNMDFSTRDRYRHIIEDVAKKSALTEYEVARNAINLSTESALTINNDKRTSHVGYYLIEDGIHKLRKITNVNLPLLKKINIGLKQYNLFIYLFSIVLITLIISSIILFRAQVDTSNRWLLGSIVFLSLLCSSQLAVSLINFLSTLLVHPKLLPRMDFSKKIPLESSALIIIPVMLADKAEIEKLIEALEVRYLANRNGNLHFGLLTDFLDAPTEILPGDKILIELVTEKINGLNVKYARPLNDLFLLFHRPRLWNPSENSWMGYERKRGKLSALNSILRGGPKEQFSVIIGDQSIFPSIKYVITLDADTQLPIGAAWKLVATMAHPLNQAWYNDKLKRVTRGYGILQPRVSLSLPEENSSIYMRMHTNDSGIDPYTRASSDVYQDLFSEGSFIGKGIYEVDIFKKVLDNTFSKNSILSHDLIEGCYIRSGLISDVELFEKYPTSYRSDMKRVLRWVRGDWQIFAWILPFIPGIQKKWHKNPLSLLSRWKIIDNIRRSLIPIALTAFIILGWFALPSFLFWAVIITGMIVIPIIITSIWNTISKPKDVIIIHHIRNSFYSIFDILKKTIFIFICFPYEAFSNLKAILQTLWRMVISKKHLLEWNPFSNEEISNPSGLRAYYYSMWISPALTVIIFIYIVIFAPIKLIIVLPILLLWTISPTITWWISKPLSKQVTKLLPDQSVFLRKLARKTWSFFEQFIQKEDNWLTPDNFQEQPISLLAHRTSPTNIGLCLLSNLTAYKFGYLSISELIERTSNTLDTMNKMERHKGHFYNWYNTESLAPLYPKYISSVDSGNLAGHLMVLKQGFNVLSDDKIIEIKLFYGLQDTLYVLIEKLKKTERDIVLNFTESLILACNSTTITCYEANFHIEVLTKKFTVLLDYFNTNPAGEVRIWATKLKHQLDQLSLEIQIFAPWFLLKSAPDKFKRLEKYNSNSSLHEVLKTAQKLTIEADNFHLSEYTLDEIEWVNLFKNSLRYTILNVEKKITSFQLLSKNCELLADMEWDFLYNKTSSLLTIGYNVEENKIDQSYYDLLASEARLCTFVCIAQGKLPIESWFALGRLLTNIDGAPILLSWSGSMFEYLMPLLVMPTYENTLLDQTCKAAVGWQIKYGKQVDLPWGISESGYNMINAHSHYQYRAFGAPGLGLKRGLEEDLVIAPYATALSLMVEPEKAYWNLELLSKKGFEGRYGFYESIDFTPSRLQRGQSSAIVYSYMAHHQGMSLLSLAYLLLDKPMQKLFESEPQFQATLLLLQERIPKASSFFAHTTNIEDINYTASEIETRIVKTPNTPIPEIQLLSNGTYHVMLTNSGAGYSRWKNLAVTRWREDVTCDNWGSFIYIRDIKSETFWSNTHQPTLKKGEKYEATFSKGRVDFRSTYNEIETHTEILVSPEDDIEIRRAKLTNRSDIRRTIEVTSYSEVVLNSLASDIAQPAFSNLFVQTEIIPSHHAIICTRRPRSIDEQSPYMFHLMIIHDKKIEEISYETDRMKFIGRGNTIENPQAVTQSGKLKGNQGSVLDPIVAIRYKISIEPGETVNIDMLLGAADTKEICLALIDKYQDKHHKDRVFELAWTHSQVVLRQINASEADAQLYSRLASSILFNNPSFRADTSILINNRRGQSGLWGYSISGDLPIVLLKIEQQSNLFLVKQLIQAHAYWRLKGIAVDLVIWNEEHTGYRQLLQNEIQSLIPGELNDRPGGIFTRATDQISSEDRILFQTVARVNISDKNGTLEDQVNRKPLTKVIIPNLLSTQPYKPLVVATLPIPKDLLFYNGLGGFSANGNEYIITLENKKTTPAPWVNVIANPTFGTIISESGVSYTWTENAHELRLTPWNNDPVADLGGEAYYLRDEESGHFWSTTLLPAGGLTTYNTRHGFGYSIFEHIEDGIYSEMTVYVDIESSVKFTKIKIRNQSGKPRKLSATGYIEWVLGNNRMKTSMYIHSEIDPESGALFGKNPYNTEFSDRVAFFDVDNFKKTVTADRNEFIGRNRTLKNPEAMSKQKLSGRTGLALDPCAAIQVPFELQDGEEHEITFRLGAGKNSENTSQLVRQFRGATAAAESLEKVKNYWLHTIGAIQVETPDTALNILTNGWLTYQTISSRLWGRSGYYQSGGAYGYRDQLQDVLSILHTEPELSKEQILRCASHQFLEGDVQHWWHPPVGRGVRTLCSDDYL